MKANQIFNVIEKLSKENPNHFGYRVLYLHCKEDETICKALESHNFKNENEIVEFLK